MLKQYGIWNAGDAFLEANLTFSGDSVKVTEFLLRFLKAKHGSVLAFLGFDDWKLPCDADLLGGENVPKTVMNTSMRFAGT